MKESVLVLGGGFAGVESAIKLCKYGYDVTLISDRDYLFVYPISIWIPVRKKEFHDVAIPLQDLSSKHGFKLIIDEVKELKPSESKVFLSKQNLDFDFLVIAMGMDKYKIKGMENTLSICGKPEESIKIREELDKLIEEGRGRIAIGFGGNPDDPSATAVRGGPAFELLFNFRTYLKKKKVSDNFELVFFAPMEEPGKKMGKSALGKMGQMFKQYDVSSHTGKKIKQFNKGEVVFFDDSRIEADMVLFIAGGNGHQVIIDSDLPQTAPGFIKIDSSCQVNGYENIFAIGDVADLNGPKWAAKQGHIAEVMADVASYAIDQKIKKSDKRKSYLPHLNIICVMDTGDGAAIIYRKGDFDMLIPLPIIGHWMKKAWGSYYKKSKMKKFPRIPGM